MIKKFKIKLFKNNLYNKSDSNDNYIIDGHHRWAAAALTNNDILAAVIDLPARDIIN